jgi:DNA-directed RNA polymerase subunit RPC12/RpoP
MYMVVVCYGCGQLLLAKSGQKTRRCPYCDARLVLDKTKKVVHVKTAQKASSVIRALKRKENAEYPLKS